MAPPPSPDLARLRLLQLADSGFPSGAYTLSHGLETLVAARAITDGDELEAFIDVQLIDKLARSDLIALLAAHAVATDPAGDPEARIDRIVAIDGRLTACRLAADDRMASSRVGRRLATEASRLMPSHSLTAFLGAVAAGRTAGNAAVAFGLAGSAFGLAARDTALAAAASTVSGIAAAAVRLGLIGHGEAQRLIAGAAASIITAVDIASGGRWQDLRPSAPQIEIALAVHETAVARQFAT